MALRALSLCSGIGGLDLALAGIARTVCYVEREGFAASCLVAQIQAGRLADAPVWSDLRTFDARAWRGAVDLVVAGFPCQPFSTASRGRSVADDLWPCVARVVREVRPRFVFLENVQRQPIQRAASFLRFSFGYQVKIAANTAASVGAPFERRRWWALADADDETQSTIPINDAPVAGIHTVVHSDWWNDAKPDLVGLDDGIPKGLAFSALGNAVVPQQARAAFIELAERLI